MKAWSLLGGLTTALGTTLLDDTQRPFHAVEAPSTSVDHTLHDEWQMEMMHDEDLLDVTEEDGLSA